MLKLLLGVAVEVSVGVMFAGLILALAIPLLNSTDAGAAHDTTTRLITMSVLASAVALAVLRPGSAIRRYTHRNERT